MAVKLKYVPVQDWHVRHVAFNMRDADVAEVKATANKTPLEALRKGMEISDRTVTVLTPDGLPLVIMGVAPRCRLTGVGSPWLLGTDEALKYKRNFLTDPPEVLDEMMDLYPKLENYVHVENRISVRWLKLLGFKMDEPVLFPNSGEKFMRFHMTRED